MGKLILISALALAGCTGQAKLTSGDYADAATTAIGVSQGFTEANPIIGVAGDAAAPIVALGVKYALQDGIIALTGDREFAQKTMNTVGHGAACANLSTIAGFEPSGAILAGIACGVIANGH